jgi:hypothetical protein
MLLTDELLRIYAELHDEALRIERDREDVRRMLRRRGVDPDAPALPSADGRRKATSAKGRRRSRPSGHAKGGTANAIMGVLADGQIWRNQDVAAQIGVTPTACSAAMRRLVARGRVMEAGYGRYRRSPSPDGHTEDNPITQPTGLFSPGDRGEGGETEGSVSPPGAPH